MTGSWPETAAGGATASARSSLQRRRWLVFSVLALMYVLVYFYRVSLAVVAQDISRELRLTPSQLGTLSGVLFFVYALAQLPLGPMIDRLGSRLVISGSGVLTALGGILFSQASGMATAMVARMLIGIGTASVLMATFTVFSHWYEKQEFGRISGLMIAVGNLGNLSATAPLALAVAAIGWRSSFLAIGVLQVLVTLLVFCKVQDRPAAVGNPATAESSGTRPGLLAAWREIFSNRDFLLLGGVSFFWYGNYLAVQGLWGGPYLQEVLALSRAGAGQMLMYTSLGFIVGSMVIDTIARRLFRSYKRTLLVGQMLLLLLMTAFLGPAERFSPLLLTLLFFAIGLAVASGTTIYPIIRSMFAVQITGTALTSVNFFVLLGAAMTQQVMGVIIGSLRQGGMPVPVAFHAAFLFPIIGLFVVLISFIFARDYWDGHSLS